MRDRPTYAASVSDEVAGTAANPPAPDADETDAERTGSDREDGGDVVALGTETVHVDVAPNGGARSDVVPSGVVPSGVDVLDPGTLDAAMRDAIALAEDAATHGEVPVGAVIIVDGEVVATGANRREVDADPTAHAEIVALRAAASAAGAWRLPGATVVVTLEPCPMCAGALLAARVGHVVFGAPDPKAGALGSLYNVGVDPRLPHTFAVEAGVDAEACGSILESFFASRR